MKMFHRILLYMLQHVHMRLARILNKIGLHPMMGQVYCGAQTIFLFLTTLCDRIVYTNMTRHIGIKEKSLEDISSDVYEFKLFLKTID